MEASSCKPSPSHALLRSRWPRAPTRSPQRPRQDVPVEHVEAVGGPCSDWRLSMTRSRNERPGGGLSFRWAGVSGTPAASSARATLGRRQNETRRHGVGKSTLAVPNDVPRSWRRLVRVPSCRPHTSAGHPNPQTPRLSHDARIRSLRAASSRPGGFLSKGPSQQFACGRRGRRSPVRSALGGHSAPGDLDEGRFPA